MHACSAFGLTIHSELPLPDFVPARTDRPDITIRYGSVAQSLEEPFTRGGTFQGALGRFLMSVPNIARYLVTDGNSILIDQAPQATDDDVRTFLLGSAMGALLLQRGLLVLHASAVQTPKGAVLFAGRSGDGKSTLMAAMTQRGYPMMSDDVTPLVLDDPERPVAAPAFPSTRLWDDAARQLDYPRDGQRRLRESLKGKFVIPAIAFNPEPQPVHKIYRLVPWGCDAIEIDTLRNAECFHQLARCSYRKPFLAALGVRERHFAQIMSLARAVKVKRVHRPEVGYRLAELVERIEGDLGA